MRVKTIELLIPAAAMLLTACGSNQAATEVAPPVVVTVYTSDGRLFFVHMDAGIWSASQ